MKNKDIKLTPSFKNIIKGNNPRTLVAFNFAIIGLAVYGLLTIPFSWALFLITVLTYSVMICLGISITYHRALTHRALIMHPVLERVGAFIAAMAGTGSPIMWVMTHRMHHRYSDKELDPHPPSKVWKTFFGNYSRVETVGMKEMVRNSFYKFIHKNYFAVVAGYALAIFVLFGVDVFFYMFVYVTLANIAISNALNWFGHSVGRVGYRNYNLKDSSANNPVMAALSFGEGWHNNHHRWPGSANFGVKKHELDISYQVIKFLEKLNIVRNVRTHGEIK